MKNFIKSSGFLLLFFMIFVSLSYMVRPSSAGRKESFAGFYAEENDSLDVVFIGSSSVFPYYASPLIWNEYGLMSYSLSTSIQRPDVMLGLIEEMKKTQSPEVVVLEMRMFLYYMEVYETDMAYFSNNILLNNLKYSSTRLKLINKTLKKKGVSLSDYIDMIQYHGNWKDELARGVRFYDYEVSDPYKGFFFKSEIEKINCNDYSKVNSKKAIPEEQEQVLYEILEYCKKDNMNVLFLASPYEVNLEEKEKLNYIGDIVESYGYAFLDLNNHYEELGLDFNTDFYNNGHVNIMGAQKVSRYLGRYLREHYNFEREHTPRQIQEWNDSYFIWENRMRQTVSEWEINRGGQT